MLGEQAREKARLKLLLLPTSSTCSFLTYLMLQALLSKPLNLLRPWGLLMFWLRTR